jgi:hypothetical protein
MKTRLLASLFLLLLALLLLSGFTTAQSGYKLVRSVIAGGGATLQNSPYSLTGTAGQPEAGSALSHGAYTLTGGFWHPGSPRKEIFLPLVIR